MLQAWAAFDCAGQGACQDIAPNPMQPRFDATGFTHPITAYIGFDAI